MSKKVISDEESSLVTKLIEKLGPQQIYQLIIMGIITALGYYIITNGLDQVSKRIDVLSSTVEKQNTQLIRQCTIGRDPVGGYNTGKGYSPSSD